MIDTAGRVERFNKKYNLTNDEDSDNWLR
jgi:large subunit ribosomal protein L31